ncbi:ABC-type multidrug transport system ATPase componen [Nostocoides japonicum T1-X7]|uniref:ABC-type multidrug transport system ATPase componen n=1 Tax=Nostocoides japonicum T1-X7 TaxID=1194083 RepID=A0A077M1M3_9MICO|nr:ABC transporter ATP-binding protein [Tetrasphaera japonica]CCH79741.1 ABC-type multidrug transport system ATPase componen [Tetrasphaera japonica T1-X7]
MPAVDIAVEVDDLRCSYGAVHAVDGASWSASGGTVTAVLGPNGAGKTTMVEILEGLRRRDSGTVRVLGTDPYRAGPEHRARVGVMLQDGGLPTRAKPVPLLRHLARMYADPADVASLAERLGIDAFAATMTRRLSGGQRQRLALAAALVGRPAVLFLDEPTAGLDPHGRLDVWDLVREESSRGASVVVTTHSFEEAERVADRVVIIAGGRVAAAGATAELTSGGSLEELYFSLTGRHTR